MNTGPHDDPHREDLAAYALGALSPSERAEVEAHIQACPACAAEVDELTETAAALALDAPPLEPPHRVKEGLLARIDTAERERPAAVALSEGRLRDERAMTRSFAEHSVPKRVLQWPLRYTAAAAAMAGAFALTATVLVTTNGIDQRVNRIEQQVAAEGTAVTEMMKTMESQVSRSSETPANGSVAQGVADVDEMPESELLARQAELQRIYQMLKDQFEIDQMQAKESTKTMILRGEGPADDAIGTLVTGHENDATGVLVVYGLPQPKPGHHYQFWVEYQGQYVSVGSFQVGPNGYAHIRLPLPEGGIEYLRGGVTEEPIGGSRVPTGTQVLNVSP